jgi:hypothetical protein
MTEVRKVTRYQKKTPSVIAKKEPIAVKKSSPTKRVTVKKSAEVEEESLEEVEEVDESLTEYLSNFSTDIDVILMAAHKLSKNQITKSAPYQPKSTKEPLRKPKRDLEPRKIKKGEPTLTEVELDTSFVNIDEVKEIIKILKGDQKKIKSEQWKNYYEKLYNQEPIGLPLKTIKTKVLDRVELLRETHQIKIEIEK